MFWISWRVGMGVVLGELEDDVWWIESMSKMMKSLVYEFYWPLPMDVYIHHLETGLLSIRER